MPALRALEISQFPLKWTFKHTTSLKRDYLASHLTSPPQNYTLQLRDLLCSTISDKDLRPALTGTDPCTTSPSPCTAHRQPHRRKGQPSLPVTSVQLRPQQGPARSKAVADASPPPFQIVPAGVRVCQERGKMQRRILREPMSGILPVSLGIQSDSPGKRCCMK